MTFNAIATREHAGKVLALVMHVQKIRRLTITDVEIAQAPVLTVVTRFSRDAMHLYLVTPAERTMIEETGQLPEDCQ